jgi:hypothetical protein
MHSMRNLHPMAIIAGPIIGYFLFFAIFFNPYWDWLFFTELASILTILFTTYCWIEVKDLPEPFQFG